VPFQRRKPVRTRCALPFPMSAPDSALVRAAVGRTVKRHALLDRVEWAGVVGKHSAVEAATDQHVRLTAAVEQAGSNVEDTLRATRRSQEVLASLQARLASLQSIARPAAHLAASVPAAATGWGRSGAGSVARVEPKPASLPAAAAVEAEVQKWISGAATGGGDVRQVPCPTCQLQVLQHLFTDHVATCKATPVRLRGMPDADMGSSTSASVVTEGGDGWVGGAPPASSGSVAAVPSRTVRRQPAGPWGTAASLHGSMHTASRDSRHHHDAEGGSPDSGSDDEVVGGGGVGGSRLSPLHSVAAGQASAVLGERPSSYAIASAGWHSAQPSPRRGGSDGVADPFAEEREKAAAELVACHVCHRRMPAFRAQRHAADCARRAVAQASLALLGQGAVHAIPPQAPTNVRVIAVGSTSVSLAWKPPLFDGGGLIHEYQVQYSRRVQVNDSVIYREYEDIMQPLASTLQAPRTDADPSSSASPPRRGREGGNRWARPPSPPPHLPRADAGVPGTLMDTAAALPSVAYVPSFTTEDAGPPTGPALPGDPSLTSPVAALLAPRMLEVGGLAADTVYTSFAVRAVNAAGPSPWSAPVREVRTRPPMPPSPPTGVAVADVTDSSMVISWQLPTFTGGVPLKSLTLRFKEQIRHFGAAMHGTTVEALSAEERAVRLPPTASRHELTGLRSSTAYVSFVVIATNAWGLHSEPSDPPISATTASMTREQELVAELERLKAAAAADPRYNPDEEIDVLYHRMFQRMSRARYQRLLEAEIEAMRDTRGVGTGQATDASPPPSPRTKKRGAARHRGSTTETGDTTPGTLVSLPGAVPSPAVSPTSARAEHPPAQATSATALTGEVARDAPHTALSSLLLGVTRAGRAQSAGAAHALEVRRRQFEVRIARLAKQVAAHDSDCTALREHQTRVTKLISDAEGRRRLVAAELELARSTPTSQLESSIIHGSRQVFPMDELRGMLTTEHDQLSATIAALRGIIHDTEAEVERVSVALGEQSALLGERRAAFVQFQNEQARFARLGQVMAAVTGDWVPRCFKAWCRFHAHVRGIKKMFIRALLRWMHRKVGAAWNTWRDACTAEAAAEGSLAAAAAGAGDAVVEGGIGTRLLAEADILRRRLLADVTATAHALGDVDSSIAAASATLTDRKLVTYMAGTVDSARAPRMPGPTLPSTAPLTRDAVSSLGDNELDAALRGALVVHARRAARTSSEAAARAEAAAAGRATATGAAADLAAHATQLVRRGALLLSTGALPQAYRELRQAELIFGFHRDTAGLLAVTRMYATMVQTAQRHDIAVLLWERCCQMARTLQLPEAEAEAAEGMAAAVKAQGDNEDAVRFLQRAEAIYERNADRPALGRVCLALVEPLQLLHREPEAAEYGRRGRDLTTKFQQALASGANVLEQLRARLHDATVADSRVISLERCSVAVPLLRQQREALQRQLQDLSAMRAVAEVAEGKAVDRLHALRKERDAIAGLRDEGTVESAVCNGGVPKRYVVGLLRLELAGEMERVGKEQRQAQAEQELVNARRVNLEEGIRDVDRHLEVERSALVRAMQARVEIKLAALNPRNLRVNDVVGLATNGIPRLGTVTGTDVTLYHTADGSAAQAICAHQVHTKVRGGEAGRRGGGMVVLRNHPARRRMRLYPTNHLRTPLSPQVITAVAIMDDMVVTGSADGSLAGWHLASDRSFDSRDEPPPPLDWEVLDIATTDRNRPRGPLFSVAAAHGSTVTSIAPSAGGFIVTGGADNLVAVWSWRGALIRQLKCHEAGVTALSASDSHFATASADHTVVLWEVRRGTEVDSMPVIEQLVRLEGHDHTVTAVANTGAEVVSGDASGVIIVWDTARGKAVRKHTVHRTGRPVQCLQFDVSKIVSYGGDQQLVVTDLWTGAPLQQTVQPHGLSRVVALQYDTFSMLTVASDRTVRVWPWRQSRLPNGVPPPSHVAARPREHIVRGEEQLMDVAQFYQVEIHHLLAWNNLRDATRTFPGQRLVLHGAPPAAAPDTSGFQATISTATAAALAAADSAAAARSTAVAVDCPPAAGADVWGGVVESDDVDAAAPTQAVAALARLRTRTLRKLAPSAPTIAAPLPLPPSADDSDGFAGVVSALTLGSGGDGGSGGGGGGDGVATTHDEDSAAARLRGKFALPGKGGRDRLQAFRGRNLAALASSASKAGAWQLQSSRPAVSDE